MQITAKQLSPRILVAGTSILAALPLLIVEMFPGQLKIVMEPASYAVFHNVAEFFSIMVSLSMFGVSWYTYEQTKNRHALFLGTAFLAIGIMDFMHTMSMVAMPDFITPNDPQKSVQFWIPVRLFQAVAFLASAYVYADKPIRWLSKRILITSSLLVSSLVFIGIIFFQTHMPTFFIFGVGVTPLKKFSEYLIILLLCAATAAYWRRMERTGDRLLIYYLAAFVVCIFSELPLAFYARSFDTYNVLGHINKIVAFFLIYYGVYRASVKEPYIRLAATGEGLKREVAERERTEEALQKSREDLEKRVEERTGDLQKANAALKAEIEERSKVEHALRESQDRYRALFIGMTEGFALHEIICDQAGKPVDYKFLDINPAFERLTGLKRETLGKTVLEVLPGLEPVWIEKYGQVALTGQSTRFDRYFPALGKHCEVFAYSPAPRQLAAIFMDITERKQMEEELRTSRDELGKRVQERTAELKRQAELIDLASNAIIVRQLEGAITLWNNGATEMYGWTKEEAVGKIARDLLQTQFPSPRDEIMAKFLKEGSWQGELIHARKDGSKLHVLSRWTLRRDKEGNPSDVILIGYDITQRVKLEEQLLHAQKMEALGTLAGGIAHDFNNLLMPILINTEMALLDIKAGVLPPAESMKLAIAGANRGKELVEQIITFSRHKEQELKPVEIAPIVKEALKFLKSTMPSTIRFQARIEDPSCLVLANPIQIHQILLNLVSNASYSMQEEGGILETSLEKIEVGKEATVWNIGPGPYVCLAVKDTGQGMTPQVKERAFDPFFTTKGPGKGTGMGLAVVHGIVKKHGGNIYLESEIGKGTTVSIFLPVFQGGLKEEASSPLAGTPTGNERILLVDDEESQTRTLETMLKRLGYHATLETDPMKALELFRSQPHAFDLVISDQVMPYLPGNKLSQELLDIRPDIPIILCTGFSETVDEEKARAIGIREFIMKPFSIREMANLIRRVLK